MDELLETKDSGFFRGLMSYWIHEDRLMWSHTRTIIAIQAGVLGVGYSLHDAKLIAALILGLGIFFTLILLVIMRHNRQTRDANAKLMEKIGTNLSQRYCDEETDSFCLTAGTKRPVIFTGRRLLIFGFFVILVVDVGMLIWVLVGEGGNSV